MPFANLYWSADYRLGIRALSIQLQQSLKQLHELRDFVARYVAHVETNSETQERFGDTIGAIGAPLKTPTGARGTRSVSGRIFSGSLQQGVDKQPGPKRDRAGSTITTTGSESKEATSTKQRTQNETNPSLEPSTSPCPSSRPFPVAPTPQSQGPVTLAGATETFKKDLLSESRSLRTVAAALDRQVLEELNGFIRLYEPVVRSALESFETLYDEQSLLAILVEKLRLGYDEARRRRELDRDTAPQSASRQEPLNQEESDEEEPEQKDVLPSLKLVASGFYLSRLSEQRLSELMKELIETVPSLRRTFALPGHSTSIVSSELVSTWLTQHRPCGLNPTRREIEHFGQELIDSKLLVGTFLGTRKFRSEGMWFEWSDLARYVAGKKRAPSPAPESKGWLDTTKRFNSLVVNVSSMLGGNVDVAETQLQQQYDQTYLQLQLARHRLVAEVSSKSQTLERFEKLRIELVFQTLTKMLEVLYNTSLASSKRLHELASNFITNINKAPNFQAEFELLEAGNSTGVFFPSVALVPDPHRTNYNNFQNIKHQFNLYKDIPLQVSVPPSELVSMASLPLFLSRTTSIIEEKNEPEIKDLWCAPLDHHSYWQLKEKVLSVISQYDNPDITVDIAASDRSVMEPILLVLELSLGAQVVNFLKNWLMEIGDSVIPFMVYDALLAGYTHDHHDTLRLLLTIPRSNLSSLVHLLEHICCVFGLNLIPNYGISDQVEREFVGEDDAGDIERASARLNDMSAIGSVPFLHTILRPSLAKASTGFKPPLELYRRLTGDLLGVNLRVQLFEGLVQSEKKYMAKKENERLGLKKTRNLTPPKEELKIPELKSPHPVAADFALRPFRTGTTPIPSPVSSPGREIHVKKRDQV